MIVQKYSIDTLYHKNRKMQLQLHWGGKAKVESQVLLTWFTMKGPLETVSSTTYSFKVSISQSYTVNIYRYKAIGANATSSVILYTGKCISPCLQIL